MSSTNNNNNGPPSSSTTVDADLSTNADYLTASDKIDGVCIGFHNPQIAKRHIVTTVGTVWENDLDGLVSGNDIIIIMHVLPFSSVYYNDVYGLLDDEDIAFEVGLIPQK